MSTNAAAAEAADDGGLPADLVEDDPRANDLEESAKRIGWKPKEEFGGPEERWQPADKFLKRATEQLPAANARIKYQDDYIKKLQESLDKTQKEMGSTIKELLDRDNKREERGFGFARQQIEARMDSAAKDADWESYQRAKADLADLDKLAPSAKTKEKEKAPEPQKEESRIDPAAQAWIDANPWFLNDNKLNNAMRGIELSLVGDYPDVATRLEKAKDELRRRYPDKFENGARQRPAAASSPTAQGNRAAVKKQKTVADLDADGKAALQRFQRMDPKFSVETYLKNYQWEK